MVRLTIFEMMNQGLVGAVRRLLGMGAGLSEILADLSIKFFGQAASTIKHGANFSLHTIQSGDIIQTTGSIAASKLPRVSGLPYKFRFIVRVGIECTDDEGNEKTNYATVYIDTNTNQDALSLANNAINTQMAKWFSGFGLRHLEEESACGEPFAEIIGGMRRR